MVPEPDNEFLKLMMTTTFYGVVILLVLIYLLR